jgi:CRP-like cAMP-binding protein
MYLIVSGSVRIVRGAHQEEIARRLAGEAIGEMSLLSHRSRTATMIAGEPVKVLIVNHRAFEQILRKSPDVCLAVMQALSDRLVEAGQRSEEAAGR